MAIDTVDQVMTLPQIEMFSTSDLMPHPEAQSIPMSKEDEAALRSGIAQDGVKSPLHITPDRRILDGVHRWSFAKELGILCLPAIVYHYEHPAQESVHTINANLQRRHINEGQRALLLLRLSVFQDELGHLQEEARERQRQAGRETTNKRWEKKTDSLVPQGTKLSVNGKATEKAAKSKGVSARTMYRAKAVANDNVLTEAVLQGEMSLTTAYQQRKTAEKTEEVKQAQESGRQLTDLEIMDGLGISVQPYDVWNIKDCDNRFGHDYPGRIPGQLVANCLYFWTEQGDTILDPMAGSGTTIDVCKSLNRHVLAYDAHPCRDDITLHDLASQGWPERASEASLIFWDPPYFKKKDDGYGDHSISRFSRSEYLEFFDHMAATIPDAFQGHLAFLMSDFNEDEEQAEPIWMYEYINRFVQHGWQVKRIVHVPLSTQQIHPDIVKKFRTAKRLARLSRELVVMKR